MSWFKSFSTEALKKTVKTIDSVLDIKEDAEATRAGKDSPSDAEELTSHRAKTAAAFAQAEAELSLSSGADDHEVNTGGTDAAQTDEFFSDFLGEQPRTSTPSKVRPASSGKSSSNDTSSECKSDERSQSVGGTKKGLALKSAAKSKRAQRRSGNTSSAASSRSSASPSLENSVTEPRVASADESEPGTLDTASKNAESTAAQDEGKSLPDASSETTLEGENETEPPSVHVSDTHAERGQTSDDDKSSQLSEARDPTPTQSEKSVSDSKAEMAAVQEPSAQPEALQQGLSLGPEEASDEPVAFEQEASDASTPQMESSEKPVSNSLHADDSQEASAEQPTSSEETSTQAAATRLSPASEDNETNWNVLSDEADKDQHGASEIVALGPIDAGVLHAEQTGDGDAEDNLSMDSLPEPEGDVAKKYAEKVATLSITLQAREEKLLSMHHERASLAEANEILRNQINQLEEQLRESHTEKLEQLTAEFTERLGELEAQVREARRERDAFKTKFQQLSQAQASSSAEADRITQKLLAEKDEQIDALMQEGKKLSDMQFKSANINKKLQAKLQDAESENAKLNKTIISNEEKIIKLEESLIALKEKHTQSKKSADEVSAVTQSQSKELKQLKSELVELKDQNKALQKALDKAHTQNEELERDKAQLSQKADAAVTAANVSAQEELKAELQRHRQTTAQMEEDYQIQLADLRAAMERAESNASYRETTLRNEISDLQLRLSQAEERAQDLSQSVGQATQPLLRQIAALQEAARSQAASWEAVEASLTQRCLEAEQSASAATQREKELAARAAEERSQLLNLEERLADMRRENIRLQTALDDAKHKYDEADTALTKMTAKCDSLRQQHISAIEEWNAERATMEQEARKNVLLAQDEAAELRRQLDGLRAQERQSRSSSTSAGGSSSVSRSSSFQVLVDPNGPAGSASTSSTSTAGAAMRVQQLEEALHAKEETVLSLQSRLASLEKNREALAEELVQAVMKNEQLQEAAQRVAGLEQQLQELNVKHEQLLQLYGEKAEESEERRLDLLDMRKVFKEQTQEMMKRIETLEQRLEGQESSPGTP